MLSYDTPGQLNGQLNGQRPTSPRSLTGGIPAAVASRTQPISPNVATQSVDPGHMANGGVLDTKHHHIWLVTGPAGCGKSTVAVHIAKALGVPYIEGDDFHTKANIEKMATGTPLNDADRWDWLTALREESRHQLAAGADGVVVTCSALKRKYRDVIRVAGYYDHSLLIHFIFLHADQAVLVDRVTARSAASDHYMGANMVASQYSILELPQPDERDVLTIDVTPPPEEVKREALARVRAMMEEDGEQGKGRAQ